MIEFRIHRESHSMESTLITLSEELPEQIYLKQVLKLIGLDDRPINDALYRLALHSQYDGLELYFSDKVLAEDSIFGELPIRFGKARGYPGSPTAFFSNIEGKKRIHQLNFYHNEQGDFAEVTTFWCQKSGIFYHCVDRRTHQLEPKTLEYNQLYVDKVELQGFCTKLEVSGTEVPDEEQVTALASTEVPDEDRLSGPPNREVLLENSNLSNNLDLTWDDLFTHRPKTDTEVFENIKQAANNYIENNESLPSLNQLWTYMKTLYEYDKKNRTILGISNKPLDKENFRKNFNRWTGKSR